MKNRNSEKKFIKTYPVPVLSIRTTRISGSVVIEMYSATLALQLWHFRSRFTLIEQRSLMLFSKLSDAATDNNLKGSIDSVSRWHFMQTDTFFNRPLNLSVQPTGEINSSSESINCMRRS